MIDPFEVIKETGAEKIFFKAVSEGFLYVIKYHCSNRRDTNSIKRCLDRLDNGLKAKYDSEESFFLPIDDGASPVVSKVLSFSRDTRLKNSVYRQMFSFLDTPLQGVQILSKYIGGTTSRRGKDHLQADLRVKNNGGASKSVSDHNSFMDLTTTPLLEETRNLETPSPSHSFNGVGCNRGNDSIVCERNPVEPSSASVCL
jgi:hypothetical protein